MNSNQLYIHDLDLYTHTHARTHVHTHTHTHTHCSKNWALVLVRWKYCEKIKFTVWF